MTRCHGFFCGGGRLVRVAKRRKELTTDCSESDVSRPSLDLRQLAISELAAKLAKSRDHVLGFSEQRDSRLNANIVGVGGPIDLSAF